MNKIGMKRGFIVVLCLLLKQVVLGDMVTLEQARKAASTFIVINYPDAQQKAVQNASGMGVSERAIQEIRPLMDNGQIIGYVAGLDPTGFVLLSSDDDAPPIKCYSDAGDFDQLPPTLLTVIQLELAENLAALASVKQVKGAIKTDFKSEWLKLLEPGPASVQKAVSEGSIISTAIWDQGDPYNHYCPYASDGPGGRANVGCVPTAMAIIMKYHQCPTAVLSNYSYTDNSGSCQGTHWISDAGMSSYKWANMPRTLNNSSITEIEAVGQLMYHAAVSVNANFGGASVNGTPADIARVPPALRTYFNYECSDVVNKKNNQSTWYQRIKENISANRPIFYQMDVAGGTGGHAVVCDGCRYGSQIHLNLGWGRSESLWYDISEVIVDRGDGYFFHWTDHNAVFDIRPYVPPDVRLSLNVFFIDETGEVSIVTATLSRAIDKAVTVNLSFSGTAKLTADYKKSASQIVIPAGSTSGSITITAVDDVLDEDTETIVITIASLVNAAESGTQKKTLQIYDNDPMPTVSFQIYGTSMAEAGGSRSIYAHLSAKSGRDVTVYLSYSGSARIGSDYTTTLTNFIFEAGYTNKQIKLTAIQDRLDEYDETVVVDIASVSHGEEYGLQRATFTIVDDDDPPYVLLKQSRRFIAEGRGYCMVSANLSRESGKPITAYLSFSGTARTANPADYRRSSNRISVSPGQTVGAIRLIGVPDQLDEEDKTVVVDISSVTNATELGSQRVHVEILDGIYGGAPLDFDGDCMTDIGCYDPASGAWYISKSSAGFFSTKHGFEGTSVVSGDFDGDGCCDYGIYYPPNGGWNIRRSSTTENLITGFGYDGTVPITGDFDGDGICDFGCYYAPIGAWYIFRSRDGFWVNNFGFGGTIPVTGDFDGDGICDFGCYYAPGGNWFLYKSRDGFWANNFGFAGTVPVTGDFDGDGICDFGCYFAPNGNWFLYKSRDGFWATNFGYGGTVPITGDYDGDGICDFGCYFAPGGAWYIFTSTSGFQTRNFGYGGTVPIK